MIDQIYKPSIGEIQSIQWTGDPFEYDLNLSRLGQGHDYFLVVNPFLEDTKIIHFIEEIPETDKCIVWKYQGDWVAKLFYEGWDIDNGYDEIEISKPRYIWNRNPDIDKLMTFIDNPFENFDPEPWDRFYKLIWYIDPRFNPLPDKVWAVSCQPLGAEIKGIKEMGYLIPDVSVEFNSHLPDLGVNIDDCCPPFWELINECAYQLDSAHNTTDEPLWVVKFAPNYRKPKSWKWLGTITPTFDVEYNPDLPKMDYELDYVIPWHDFTFEHVWMLDRKHLQNGEDDIWAFKIRVSNDIEGSKQIDYISPTIKFEYNSHLPRMHYDIDYVIPWYDLKFKHVWYLDTEVTQGKKIWAAKLKANTHARGEKVLGYVIPEFKNLDVIFISYHEPNAEQNWQRVKEFAPWAKRVLNIEGIDRAHRAAAELSETDMFYVVDGDAYLVDGWNFDFQPGLFERTHTHIWSSKNPFNDLDYGYGGVKLMSRSKILSNNSWKTLDYSTTVNKDIQVMNTVSNISMFNTDEFSTWRGAFRECVKLCSQGNTDYVNRWTTNKQAKFYQFAVYGVLDAIEFFKENKSKPKRLLQINDRDWLEKEFNVRYKLPTNTKSYTNHKRRKS